MTPEKIGRYKVIEPLGNGGMAKVYLALHEEIDRQVAIKVIDDELAEDPEFRKRFRREAKAIANLEHATIVRVYDFGEHEGKPYLVMHYMRGGSLLQRLQKGDPVSLEEASLILDRLARALEAAHQRDIIHRDIKPGNVLLDENGQYFLSDFGIVHLVDTATVPPNELEVRYLKGVSPGTPQYMAPEQWISEEPGPYTDVYQLGIMMFELVTGQRPFPDASWEEMKQYHLEHVAPPVQTLRPNILPKCAQSIAKAIEKSPMDRYATPLEFAEDFAKAINPESINGRYTIEEEIQTGRHAKIYRAFDKETAQMVAVKLFQPYLLTHPKFQREFQQTGAWLTQVQHPNLLQIMEAGVHEGKPYLIMPIVTAESLRQTLNRSGRLPLETIRSFLPALADCLDHLAENGHIHRDIVPGNILLDQTGHCYITGLGTSDILERTELMHKDEPVGNHAYMAPEQWLYELLDNRTVVYQVGVMLFELLCGERPYQADDISQLKGEHFSQAVPQITQYHAELPSDFNKLLTRAMAQSRQERFSTLRELADALIEAHQSHIIASLLQEGRKAHTQRNWDEAAAAFSQILAVQPDHTEARSRLERAHANKRRAERYARGRKEFEEENWQDAIHFLEEVKGYEDTDYLLNQARKNLRIEELYQESIQAGQVGEWMKAREKLIELDGLRPNYKDVEQQLLGIDREIYKTLSAARSAQRQGNWDLALSHLQKLNGHNEANQLREEIRQQKQAERQQPKKETQPEARPIPMAAPASEQKQLPEEEIPSATPLRSWATLALVIVLMVVIIYAFINLIV